MCRLSARLRAAGTETLRTEPLAERDREDLKSGASGKSIKIVREGDLKGFTVVGNFNCDWERDCDLDCDCEFDCECEFDCD